MIVKCIDNCPGTWGYFITVGKIYQADVDLLHQPDCYWIVNDQNYYSPYKKELFITEKEIRKQKLEQLQCLK